MDIYNVTDESITRFISFCQEKARYPRHFDKDDIFREFLDFLYYHKILKYGMTRDEWREAIVNTIKQNFDACNFFMFCLGIYDEFYSTRFLRGALEYTKRNGKVHPFQKR